MRASVPAPPSLCNRLTDPPVCDPERKPESALEAIGDLQCPLLGLYGDEDHLIPLEDVRELERRLEEHWPVHAVPGTEGFELLPGLPRPADYDFFVWKGVELDMHPYGACFHDIAETMSTGVIEWLQARNISHVLVGGLATDFCVLNRAACRGIADESTRDAIEAMRSAGVAFVDSCDDLEAAR